MSLRLRWISKCNTKAQEILDKQAIITKEISKLPGPGNVCEFDYTIKMENTNEKEIRMAIEEVELEPTFIYVLDVLDDVEDMKMIILSHVKTIYPFITNLISYTFEDGVMFVPLGRTISSTLTFGSRKQSVGKLVEGTLERIYVNLSLPDYRIYSGMIPISNVYELTRYSLHLNNYNDLVKLGKIYLSKDSEITDEISYLNRSLRDEGYFALTVDTPQDIQLYTELAGLWGCQVMLKESDYICLRSSGKSEVLNYVPSYKEFFTKIRDSFPSPPSLLIHDSYVELFSLYSLRFFLQSGELPELQNPSPPSNIEFSLSRENGQTKFEVYQKEIYDTAYYNDTPENVEKRWLNGSLFTDWCKVNLTELNKISFYCLIRE